MVALAANVKSSRQVEKNHDAFVKQLKRWIIYTVTIDEVKVYAACIC